MALDDVKHVQAVAIIRELIESPWAYAMPAEARQGVEAWLTENHPPANAYMAATARNPMPKPGMSSVQELRAALAKGLDPETLERIDRIAEGE